MEVMFLFQWSRKLHINDFVKTNVRESALKYRAFDLKNQEQLNEAKPDNFRRSSLNVKFPESFS